MQIKNLTEEQKLKLIAETFPDDELANEAMNQLRTKFDETYFFCDECDGIVCKEKDCCLNAPFLFGGAYVMSLNTFQELFSPTKTK